jgi:hypothetical protein
MSSRPKTRAILCCVVLFYLFTFFDLAEGQDSSFTLDVLATSGQKEVSLTVPATGVVPITLIRLTSAKLSKSVDLHLSEFTNEAGGSIRVNILIPGDSTVLRQPDRLNVKIPKTLLPIQLIVPEMPTSGRYTGRLVLTSNGKPMIWVIALSRRKPQSAAELVVDRQTISLAIVNPLLHVGRNQGDLFTVTLREKGGEWPLEDIAVSLEQVTKAPQGGFDFDKIDFIIDGRRIPGTSVYLMNSRKDTELSATHRLMATIPGGGQAIIGVRLHGLTPGEYNATLRFRARNSVESDAQKVVLAVRVRSSEIWAVFLLMIGILTSFVGTKGLLMIRQRSALQKQISDMKQPWLLMEPDALPVIWARATLQQAEDLSRSFWLSSPDVIESRLSQVGKLLPILHRISELRVRLEQVSGNDLVTRRAMATLHDTVSLLGEGPPEDKTRELLEKKLTKLSEWPDKLNECYGETLREAIRLFLESVSHDEVIASPEEIKGEINKLMDILMKYQPLASLDENIRIEGQYARLKVLWERRGDDKIGELVNQSKNMSLEQLFKRVDDIAWNTLKESNEREELKLHFSKASSQELLETHEPLSFSLSTGDPRIDETYLFQRGLRYEWLFTLDKLPEKTLKFLPKRKKGELPPLTETSVEPHVVQYAPWPSTLIPSVKISYKGEEIGVKHRADALSIRKSHVFRWYKGLQIADWFSVLISVVLGIVTGMATLYYTSETFGSGKDYLTLFLWGAGVDQAKNFLQLLQAYTTKPVSSP